MPEDAVLGLLRAMKVSSACNIGQRQREIGLRQALNAAHDSTLACQLYQAPVAVLHACWKSKVGR